jgi:3-ketosteroid 9alpha-monooxygenase subunit A
MNLKMNPPGLSHLWVFITFTNKIKCEQIIPLTIVDKHLVLWKSQSGQLSLLDAYCPHLGAHLEKGTIKGEMIQCNFHNRKFDVNGICSGFGKNNPSYILQQVDNMIFAWFGDTAPTWEVPSFLKGFAGNDDSSEWKILKTKKLNYNFAPKDLLDNTVDPIHFKTFHKQCDNYKPIEIISKNHFCFISKATFIGHPSFTKRNIPFLLELVTESYGPTNLIVSATAKFLGREYYFKFIFLCTPKASINTDYTLSIAIKTKPKQKLSIPQRLFLFFYVREAFRIQIKEFRIESRNIWETKTYLENPDYFPQEQAMNEYNEWYKQFFIKDLTTKVKKIPIEA